jgi:acyl carrier protein
MQTAIATDVRNFVVGNFLLGQQGTLVDDASFLDEGIIDSTGILELVSYLEETYEIEITEEELVPENLDSITRIAAYLSRKLNGRACLAQGEALLSPASL